MTALLEARNITVSYGAVQAVRDFSFEVHEGEIVLILGANGAGKSSTLNAIMGLAPVTGGQFVFDGEDITGRPTEALVRRRLTLTPEGRRVFPDLTVEENLILGGISSGDQQAREIKSDMLRMFPILKERRAQKAGTLSGGEQQMLAIARSMMSSPRLLLLDEPSLGLAPLIVEEVFRLVSRLRDQGTTIVLVEQNVNQSLAIADRGYVLETGQLTISGAAQDLMTSQDIKNRYLGGS